MSNFLMLVSRECTVIFFAAIFILFTLSAVYIDVNWMHNALHENSVTEIVQEIILAVIALLFFGVAVKRNRERGALILIGGFYCCMLIRELDELFDMIHHGSWLLFALATSASCLIISMYSPDSIITGLTQFIQHRTWLMTVTGLLIILVFSRLFGMHQLWQYLMLDGYNRTVKNMAEESTELLGYSVCFISSVLYLLETRDSAVITSPDAGI